MLHPEYLWEQETDHVQYILEPYSALRGHTRNYFIDIIGHYKIIIKLLSMK